jgi:uncharacterized phage infection (PIP) family protein YhgE
MDKSTKRRTEGSSEMKEPLAATAKTTAKAIKRTIFDDIYTLMDGVKSRQEEDSRFLNTKIDALSNQLNQRIDMVGTLMVQRIDTLNQKIDNQGGELRQEIGQVRQEMGQFRQEISSRLDSITQFRQEISSRLDSITQLIVEILRQKNQK